MTVGLAWIAAGFLLLYSVVLTLVSLIHTQFSYPRWVRRLVPPEPELRANIVVPCQELTEHLEGNLRAMAEQDYGPYVLTMVTDTATDPAVAAIRSIVRDYPRARHLVTGYADTRCSQQNFVQAVAMSADTESDVLVKCDSDTRPHPGWLRDFLRPYADPRIAATSSHRWISPLRPGFVNGCYTLLSAWLTTFMGLPCLPWIWGGCFGIRRSVFRELDVAGLWRRTGTDDSTLRNRLVESGKRVVFVPDCVGTSHESHEDLGEFVRWISRQLFHGKVYVLGAWALILVAETLVFLALVFAICTLAVGIAAGGLGSALLPAVIVLVTVPLTGILVKLPHLERRDIPLSWWALLQGAIHVLSCHAAWRTVFMRRLLWRGRIYEFNLDGTVRSVVRLETGESRTAWAHGSIPSSRTAYARSGRSERARSRVSRSWRTRSRNPQRRDPGHGT